MNPLLDVVSSRLKSFFWRFAAYIVTAALAWLSSNIGLLHFAPEVTAVIALLLGELTKFLNSNLPWLREQDPPQQ